MVRRGYFEGIQKVNTRCKQWYIDLADSDRQRELHAKVWPYQDLCGAVQISNSLDEYRTSFGSRRRLVSPAHCRTARKINLLFSMCPKARGMLISADR